MCIRLDRLTNEPKEIPLSISLQFSHDDSVFFGIFISCFIFYYIEEIKSTENGSEQLIPIIPCSFSPITISSSFFMCIASSLIAAWHRFVYHDGFVDRLSLIFSWRLLDALISFCYCFLWLNHSHLTISFAKKLLFCSVLNKNAILLCGFYVVAVLWAFNFSSFYSLLFVEHASIFIVLKEYFFRFSYFHCSPARVFASFFEKEKTLKHFF